MNRDGQAQRQERSSNRQIIFIILIYLLLTMNTTDNDKNSNKINRTKQQIKSISQPPPSVNQMFLLFESNKYEGVWQINENNGEQNNKLKHSNGKFQVHIYKRDNGQYIEHGIAFIMNDGYYIDDGTIITWINIKDIEFETIRNVTQITIKMRQQAFNSTKKLEMSYQHSLILQQLQNKKVNVTQYDIMFNYNRQTDHIVTSFYIETEQFSWKLTINSVVSKFWQSIIFASLLFGIAFVEFASIMSIYRNAFDGSETIANYSIITILICSLWDATISIFSFLQTFSNDDVIDLVNLAKLNTFYCSIISFPHSFYEFGIEIDNAYFPSQIKSTVEYTKYNIYGSLIMLYPLLYLTNLSPYLFIFSSLLLFSQILVNGQKSIRPKLNSPYYRQFIPIRFLLIIYFRAYPWNICELQPNYFLVFCCFILIIAQYLLLWVQAKYGPRKVLPQLLLPAIYNYQCQIDENVQQGTQMDECAICLTPLNAIPADVVLNFQCPHKVMKSPCGHKYHGPCLIKWMEIKMQCPQCRTVLPPFQ